jgi:DNA-binding transcriptional ArsR family regulator
MNARIRGNERWINQQTGEIIETQTLTKEVQEVDIGFHKLWIAHILETIEEVGNAKVKVLFWLLKNADQNNLVKGTLDTISERTEVSRSSVARLMAALRKADVVRLEYGGRWLLNPGVIFKGGHGKRMNVLIRYKSMEQQELPLEEHQQQQPESQRISA